jgi:hypothetical protein
VKWFANSTCRSPGILYATAFRNRAGLPRAPKPTLVTTRHGVVVVGVNRLGAARMGIVIQFRRPVASPEVIAKLVELGYLRADQAPQNWRRRKCDGTTATGSASGWGDQCGRFIASARESGV